MIQKMLILPLPTSRPHQGNKIILQFNTYLSNKKHIIYLYRKKAGKICTNMLLVSLSGLKGFMDTFYLALYFLDFFQIIYNKYALCSYFKM